MTSIHIIIVNYHCQQLILRCLASLTSHLTLPHRVVVVDNSESPDTDLIAREYPGTVLLRPGSNGGFAAGCNFGIRHSLAARADYLLLLNPDTYTENDFLTPMISVMEENKGLGMVGPKIFMAGAKKEIWNAGGRLNWWLGGQRRLLPDPKDGSAWQHCDYLSGCAMLLRSETVRQAGLMDERYFLYFEDIDYLMQIKEAGWQIGYVHSSELFHQLSSTTELHSESYVYHFARNRVLFMRKWASTHQYVFFTLYNLLCKLPAALLFFGVLRRKPRLFTSFCNGLLQGLKLPVD